MPDEKVVAGQYQVRPNDDGTYRVVNRVTGKTHAKSATHEDAEHQKQLLYAVGHGWHPAEGS